MVRKQVVVRGVVQGVGFRYYTQTEARRLGLAGHVRNRGDGAVEVELEGDAATVWVMLSWLQHGPPSARVEAVEVTTIPPLGETGFQIGF
ncbi:acylphosphatase [Cryobacterium sp. TMT1-62]|uniref:acylphosphatase n=1 Tax=Cryobacterium sp. TMT1-62 TaxID=1259240 RepID=UPI0010697408|nr:acylphosphatase [Cryobacterium sp. TMT1-62]TFD35331.1 acylphosphatase [Cryobacterium sp. TMT1-62]